MEGKAEDKSTISTKDKAESIHPGTNDHSSLLSVLNVEKSSDTMTLVVHDESMLAENKVATKKNHPVDTVKTQLIPKMSPWAQKSMICMSCFQFSLAFCNDIFVYFPKMSVLYHLFLHFLSLSPSSPCRGD